MFTTENFITGIRAAANISIETQEAKLILGDLRGFENEVGGIGEIPLDEINALINELENGYTYSNSMLWTGNTFEIAVKPHDRMRMPFQDRSMYELAEHNYNFSVSKASIQYLFSIVCYSATNTAYELDMWPSRAYNSKPISSLESFFDLFRISTVKISGLKQHSLSLTEFKRMLHSYLFNISYNHNISLTAIDFSENRRYLRRRARRTGQLFPYKEYNQELTTYYHQALATDIPFTQYLAFYHVAEFFFQAVSEQDTFDEIKTFITRPSFSPYRKEDIKRFYNRIKKKMKEQRDDGVWNEKTGLLLCLKKYVPDLESLKASIETIDSSAIGYYRNTLVEFADGGKTIKFDEDTDKIYCDIRDRVYSVRNAIVHSKEGDRLRYEPFRHDKQLAKEIPLIRCIAEEIIINSAKPIEYILRE